MLQESMRTSQKWRLGTLLLLGPLIALLLSSCTPRSPLDETPIPIGTTEPSMEVPAPVTPPAVPLACGSETYFAIRKDGTLIGWGNNENGTLGGSDLHIPVTEPREIMTDIRAVSSGQWVTLMIDKENTLWGIGMDYFGHLGPDEDKQQPVRLMEDVVMASTSAWHCLALKGDGSLWCWGMGRNGVPGVYELVSQEYTPPEKIMDDVLYAVCYRNGGYAIKADHTLWEWGVVSSTPEKILEDVQYVQNCMAILTNGDMVTWAYTEDGERTEPELRLHDVACGMTGVAVQTDGTLYVETVSDSGSTYEAVIEDVEYAVTGAEYTLVLKQDGTLWTWNSAGEGDVSQIMDGIGF